MEKFIYVDGEFVDRISDNDLGIIEKCFGGKITSVKDTNFLNELALEIYIETQ